MIHKLEEELGLRLFDRSRQPVVPTEEGKEVIKRARVLMNQVKDLKEYAGEHKGEVSGELRLGIIPTLAPYLLPLFLKTFHDKYPGLHISVKEMLTDDIVSKLQNAELDMGIVATPLHEKSLTEQVLFYEEFFVYASKEENLPKKKYLLPKQIDVNHLWLLEEGHCLRNQVFNLCELKKQEKGSLSYEAGSIESLINLVDSSEGITIIPGLAALRLKGAQKQKVREFAHPKPVREISLVTREYYSRIKLVERLKETIIRAVPPDMLQFKRHLVTKIQLT